MDNKRSAQRVRSLLAGRIIFNGGHSSFDCVIRDISDTGAKLQLDDSSRLPEKFDLFIPKRDDTRRATIKWRAEREIGVEFAQPEAAAPSVSNDVAQRLVTLESENAALRRQVAALRAELDQARDVDSEGLYS